MSDAEYWFEVSPLLVEHEAPARPALADFRDRWSKDRSARGRISSLRNADAKGLLKDALLPDRRNRIEEFAHANGLDYRRWQKKTPMDGPADEPGAHRPGLVFDGGDSHDLVSWQGWPFVEFGNLSQGGLTWGFVALRHDLQLPHVVLDAVANDPQQRRGRPAPPTSLTRREGLGSGGGRTSRMDRLKGRVARLDLGQEMAPRFTGWGEIGREEEVRHLLTGEELRAACEASSAFDVEITSSWVFLYGYGFDVSTTEPDRWAWIFSLTSRWIDVGHAWADGSAAAQEGRCVARPPFHTEEPVPRPSSLEVLPRATGDLGGGEGPWNGLGY